MLFIAFNLKDFHKESSRDGVRFRVIEARSLKHAKEFMSRDREGA